MDIHEKPFLTIREASEFTGYAINSLYAYVQRGTIPYFKAQGIKSLRFDRVQLEDWIKGKKFDQ